MSTAPVVTLFVRHSSDCKYKFGSHLKYGISVSQSFLSPALVAGLIRGALSVLGFMR